MSRSSLVFLGLAAAFTFGAACDGGNGGNTGGNGSGAGSGTNAGGASTTGTGKGGMGGSGAADVGGGTFAISASGTGGTVQTCDHMPNEDGDADGWTGEQGDCNDCDSNVNPGAIEVMITEPVGDAGVPEPADEDCDGHIDNVAPTCDDSLVLGDTNALNGARAMDLCQSATPGDKKWGVLSAKYVGANGAPRQPGLQAGLLDKYGDNVHVQMGKRMLGLSTGKMRTPGQNGACATQSCNNNTNGPAPAGFPQAVANCPPKPDIHDDIALELNLRAPTNATGYKFNFKFSSYEFPEYVCTDYNDQFIALVAPPPMGAPNGNISFDTQNHPVSVNIAFFDVCNPATIGNFASQCVGANCPTPPNPYCPQGMTDLAGTGMAGTGGDPGDGGQTAWLQTVAPIKGADEFVIRFAIWDTGDHNLDSNVLIDAFEWIATGGTPAVGTVIIPAPK